VAAVFLIVTAPPRGARVVTIPNDAERPLERAA
jgi:hypothetical protein